MRSDFALTKQLFDIPDGTIYLDGNSLGPPTKTASDQVSSLIEEKWAKLLIKSWNLDNWIDKPKSVGNRIAKVMGAKKNSVIVGDTLSIKTYQALYAAIKLQPERKIILSDSGNFPSDLYIAQGLIDALNLNYQLRTVKPEQIFESITSEVAILFLTEVDFRTGRKHDMIKLTKKAKEMGLITIWDLAHSIGVLPINIDKAEADFAVGCTYKYLNGGPGSPAFLYVAPKHLNNVDNIIKGWFGHTAPFSFNEAYQPASGINKMQIGTPPIIATAALEASLDILETVNIQDMREKSIELTELFIEETKRNCPMLKLISPICPYQRGAHLAFEFKEGYAVIQSLMEHNVIGDFRYPNLMRFGFNPLFICENNVLEASKILSKIMTSGEWNKKIFKIKSFVT